MKNKILIIGLIFFKILPSTAQNWELNQTVFQGNYLAVADSIVFINNNSGFWISSNLGESFQYKKFSTTNGNYFTPISFINSENNSFSKNILVEFNLLPAKVYDFVEINNTLDTISRTNSAVDRNFNNVYSVFNRIICAKSDSIFKFNQNSKSFTTLNTLSSDNNFAYVNWVGELNFPSTYFLKRQGGKIHFVQSDTNFTSSFQVFSFKSIGFSLSVPSKQTFVLGGDNGQVYISNDFANTFSNISLGFSFPVSVCFNSNKVGIAYKSTYQNGRKLFYTTNGGEDWLEVELPKDLINVKGAAIKNNKVLVFGFDTVYQQTRLYQTDDITQHSIINTIKGGQPAPIGLTETKIQNNINIYPNPTNQNFTIEATEIPKAIKLFNVVGQLVYSETPMQNTNQIQVSHLPKGMYFVQIQQQNGESLLRKVVVN